MNNFWQTLPLPFTVLAPMDGVTDVVFRQIITQIGKPDVLFTEFINCDGLMSKGHEKVGESLKFLKNEKPIVAQIWGINPETFYKSAKYCKELGFSGIDINMGCPIRTITKDGSCSALIKNPNLAKELITAAKEGAGGLPVSVKTRLGFNSIQLEEWIGFLLKQDLQALTVHLRTVEELSKVPAHWELMPEIVKLRNELSPKTLIIGNGDLKSMEDVEDKCKLYKNEGFMVGRGIFTNPWMFNKKINQEDVTIAERIDLFKTHIQLFDKMFGTRRNAENLKKFCKVYIANFPDAGLLREEIMKTKKTKIMLEILTNFNP